MMFNLTKRQLICFGMAALIGVPSFFFIKNGGDSKYSSYGDDGDHDAVFLYGYV